MAVRSHSYKTPSLRLAWLCDKGLVRTDHENALLVQKWSSVLSEGYEAGTSDVELSSDPLFLGVADGYGSRSHEDSIGQDILRYIANVVFSTESPRTNEELQAIIRDANRYQNNKSNRRVDPDAMGLILTAALVDDQKATIAHVGDSQCYLYRSSKIWRITMDRSLVAQMIQYGQITAEEAQLDNVSISTLSLSSPKFAAPPPDVRQVSDLPRGFSPLYGATPQAAGA